MRLAYLVNLYPTPATVYFCREVAELRRRGVEVDLISLRRFDGDLPGAEHRADAAETNYIREQGVARLALATISTLATRPLRFARAACMSWSMARRAEKSMLHPLAYLMQACALLRLARRLGADHLHVQRASNAGTVARLTRHLGGPAYGMMVHGPEEFDDLRSYAVADKITDSLFTMAVSDARARQLRECIAGRHRHKVHTVRCGVATNALRPQPVPDVCQFICVARLVERKGHELLIEAVAPLVTRWPDLRILCVGDGDRRAALEALAAATGLADHVLFTGALDPDSVLEQIRASRGLVLASRDETLPLSIVEAFACRRPVICTNVGSVGEVVDHGINGWLVAPDAEALTHALHEALVMPVARLTAMGDDGARVVARRHSIRTEVGKILALYETRPAPQGA